MLFNSFIFLYFLIITFVIYYLPFLKRQQINILIISSLIFYAYNKPILLLLFFFSISINTVLSYFLSYGKQTLKKILATLGIIVNIGILGCFKYIPWITTLLIKEISPEGSIADFFITLPLPIGISFYTFEGISLIADIYRNRESKLNLVSKNFLVHIRNTAFFISFFPHLISGPILKAHDFFPQIGEKEFKDINWDYAGKQLILGYFFKMVIADNLKYYTYNLEFPYYENLDGLSILVLIFGYSFQIFSDFAGYSLIALGLASLFGYRLIENFNFPYISQSITEFWTRWHISLSTWLKEYLYIPLGGNRKGRYTTYSNLMIVMIIGGLWHGAGFRYLAWGLIHGLLLVFERAMGVGKNINYKYSSYLKILITFTIVSFAWLCFKMPNFNIIIKLIQYIVLNFRFSLENYRLILSVLLFSIPPILYHLLYLNYKIHFKNQPLQIAIYSILLFLIMVNSGATNEFIYFQF